MKKLRCALPMAVAFFLIVGTVPSMASTKVDGKISIAHVGGLSADTTGLSVDTASTAAMWNPEWGSKSCDLSRNNNLSFGGIICSNVSGTVTVTASGSATYSAGAIDNPAIAGPKAAQVQLNLTNQQHCEQDDHCQNDDNEYCRTEGDDNRTNDTRSNFERHGVSVTISISSSSTMRLTGGSATMTVDNYTFRRNQGYIDIGGKLHVNANQASGVYSGTFNVTAICQ